MRALVRSALCAALPALLAAPAARAEGEPAKAGEHRVDFSAERVELEPDEGALELDGDVIVRSDRFQITSDAMTLSRSPRGVHVEGDGRLSFCRCVDPPVTLGFSAADLAPPTDVLLEDATFRVGGVPVFYAPYLWLRAPDRVGFLPPFAAYRGEEGVLVGGGVHVPFAEGDAPVSALDLRAGGYARGGARVELRAEAEGGRAEAAWDHLGGTALELRSSFATAGRSRAVLAGRADLVGGERGLEAPFAIDTVSRRADRWKAAVGVARSAALGFSLEGSRERGAALSEPGVLGPALELGLGTALGRRARFGASLGAFAARRPGGAASQSSFASELSGAAPWGPLLGEILLRDRGDAATLDDGHAVRGEAELRARLGLPLVRRYAALVHRIEPWLEVAARAGARDERGPAVAWLADRGAPDTHIVTALAGLETALGGERSAFDARLGAGSVGSGSADVVFAGRARLDAGAFGLNTEARALPEREAIDAFFGATLGTRDSVRAGFLVEGARRDPAGAHRLFAEDWLLPRGAFFDRSGLGAGARLGVPWGYGFDTEVGADFDVTNERLLAGTAALGYRHPCRCLELGLWGGRRLGRDGIDVAFSLDLVP